MNAKPQWTDREVDGLLADSILMIDSLESGWWIRVDRNCYVHPRFSATSGAAGLYGVSLRATDIESARAEALALFREKIAELLSTVS